MSKNYLTGVSMKNVLVKLTVPLICSALVFSGCGTSGTKNYSSGQGNTNTGTKTNSTNGSSTQTSNKTDYSSGATSSTNSTGTTGAGTSGISGTGTSAILGTGGLSSSLENQLRRAGINGTKVLVLDDTVILGQSSTGSSAGTTSGTRTSGSMLGTTGVGTTGTYGANGTSGGSASGNSSNLSNAQSQIQRVLGDIRILTVSDAEALRAMDRVKSALKTTNFSHAAVSADITTIIRSAKQSSSTIRPNSTYGIGSSTYSGSGSSTQTGSNAR
jgi:hypothetical protein